MRRFFAVVSVSLLLVLGMAGRSDGAWTWTTIDYPEGTATTPRGVYGNKIVGSYKDANQHSHGFLWDNGQWSTIEPPGALAGNATAISESGIVGNYVYLTGGSFGLFVTDAYTYSGGTYTPLHMPGVDGGLSELHAVPMGIDGTTIIGQLADSWLGVFIYQNFVYDGHTRTSLNAPGATSTDLYGISGNKIVGIYRGTIRGARGFLYDLATDSWNTLTFQPTGEEIVPYGIDGDRIVGRFMDGFDRPYGFYYDGTTWFSLSYPGSRSTVARAISGNNIVGYYTDADGTQHGFILTVPEPTTLSLLALGGLLIARRRNN